jgi:hypothetical protein
LPTSNLKPAAEIVFTVFWQNDQRWEGTDFSVKVEGN